jgi:hypothetical protein
MRIVKYLARVIAAAASLAVIISLAVDALGPPAIANETAEAVPTSSLQPKATGLDRAPYSLIVSDEVALPPQTPLPLAAVGQPTSFPSGGKATTQMAAQTGPGSEAAMVAAAAQLASHRYCTPGRCVHGYRDCPRAVQLAPPSTAAPSPAVTPPRAPQPARPSQPGAAPQAPRAPGQAPSGAPGEAPAVPGLENLASATPSGQESAAGAARGALGSAPNMIGDQLGGGGSTIIVQPPCYNVQDPSIPIQNIISDFDDVFTFVPVDSQGQPIGSYGDSRANNFSPSEHPFPALPCPALPCKRSNSV